MTDDGFHPSRDGDPFWTETCWSSFFVPERRLSGTLYPLFRRNLGICSSGVHLWDDTASVAHEIVYDRMLWHLPFPDEDLSDVTLASGLRYRCVEPGMRFELGYDDGGELALDLTFEGLIEPHYLGPAHLDQPGRVRGSLTLRGERIAVDCMAMRDRTWSRRSDIEVNVGGGSHRGAYSYGAASPSEAFQAITAVAGGEGEYAADAEYQVLGGFLLRDGEVADLVGGTRRVMARDDAHGHQRRVTLTLEDAKGRALSAEGVCHNAFAWQFTPGMFSWNCLTEWTWPGGTGWGEDHDNWSSAAWRAFRRRGSFGSLST
jgi:hypothetical protein